jgi:thioredoxin-related protein
MENELFSTKEFASLIQENNVVLVRLDFTETDTDEKVAIAEKYQIRGLPTLVISDEKGNLVDSLLGFRDIDTSLRNLKDIFNSK